MNGRPYSTLYEWMEMHFELIAERDPDEVRLAAVRAMGRLVGQEEIAQAFDRVNTERNHPSPVHMTAMQIRQIAADKKNEAERLLRELQREVYPSLAEVHAEIAGPCGHQHRRNPPAQRRAS